MNKKIINVYTKWWNEEKKLSQMKLKWMAQQEMKTFERCK